MGGPRRMDADSISHRFELTGIGFSRVTVLFALALLRWPPCLAIIRAATRQTRRRTRISCCDLLLEFLFALANQFLGFLRSAPSDELERLVFQLSVALKNVCSSSLTSDGSSVGARTGSATRPSPGALRYFPCGTSRPSRRRSVRPRPDDRCRARPPERGRWRRARARAGR